MLLQIYLDEAANLPLRSNWATKGKLLGANAVISLLSLLGIPIGFAIASLEPPNTICALSFFGFILIVAAPIAFIYFLGKAIYLFIKPFNAKSLFEYFFSIRNEFSNPSYYSNKERVEKIQVPVELILPSSQDKYKDVCHLLSKLSLEEAYRQGWVCVDVGKRHVTISDEGCYATCVTDLNKRDINNASRTEPLGKMTLHAVKSNAGDWYLIIPDLDNVESWLKFTPSDNTDAID